MTVVVVFWARITRPGGMHISQKDEKDMIPLLKSAVSDTLDAEDLVLEALKDMVKEEIKRKIKDTLDRNPELREEIKDSISMYLEARARQLYATMKIAKGAAKLGLSLIPEDLKKEMSREILSIFEKELSGIMDKDL